MQPAAAANAAEMVLQIVDSPVPLYVHCVPSLVVLSGGVKYPLTLITLWGDVLRRERCIAWAVGLRPHCWSPPLQDQGGHCA